MRRGRDEGNWRAWSGDCGQGGREYGGPEGRVLEKMGQEKITNMIARQEILKIENL